MVINSEEGEQQTLIVHQM